MSIADTEMGGTSISLRTVRRCTDTQKKVEKDVNRIGYAKQGNEGNIYRPFLCVCCVT